MSERVRMAVALDAVEELAKRCGEHAKRFAMETEHMQNELSYVVADEIDRFARTFGVDYDDLRRNALRMLHDELRRDLCDLCDVRYVKQMSRDGEPVGMTVKFYKRWRAA